MGDWPLVERSTEALIDGEDPATMDAEVADRWVDVYSELVDYTTDLLATSSQGIGRMSVEARVAARETEVMLRLHRERLRRRLTYWIERGSWLRNARP